MCEPHESMKRQIVSLQVKTNKVVAQINHRSQVGFGFVFTVSDSDSQFRIQKSNTKLENLKAVLSCF